MPSHRTTLTLSATYSILHAPHVRPRVQSVYLAGDLVAAGIVPGEAITAVGWQLQTRRRATGVVVSVDFHREVNCNWAGSETEPETGRLRNPQWW